jgi:hypothetical protein
MERRGSSFNAVAAADAGNGGGNCAAEKLAGEPISRIWISDLQMHNLRGINERFSIRDLWRQAFLTEVKTSDMFLACSVVGPAVLVRPIRGTRLV